MVNDGNPPTPEDLDVTVEVRVVVTTVVDGAFQVLLRQRTVPPFLGSWELPGGPLQPGEGLEDTAKRELAKAAPTYNKGPVDRIDGPGTLDATRREFRQMLDDLVPADHRRTSMLAEAEALGKAEALAKISRRLADLWAVVLGPDRDVGSRPYHLEQFGAYGDPDPIPEDSPERVVSIGYWAIVPSLADTAIGDDVASPKLFPVALVEGGQAGESIEVRLAFNHGQMLADAIERARDRLEDTTIVASFCGPEFTISELRGVYDAVWRTKLDPGNFQRKVKQTNDFLVSQQRTNHSDDKAGRPAALWSLGSATRLNPPLSRPNPS